MPAFDERTLDFASLSRAKRETFPTKFHSRPGNRSEHVTFYCSCRTRTISRGTTSLPRGIVRHVAQEFTVHIYISIFLYTRVFVCVSVCLFVSVCIIYKYSTHSLYTGISVSAFCFTFILTLTLFIYIVPCFLPSVSSSSRSAQRSRRKSRPPRPAVYLSARRKARGRNKLPPNPSAGSSVGCGTRELFTARIIPDTVDCPLRARELRVVAGEIDGIFLLLPNHPET